MLHKRRAAVGHRSDSRFSCRNVESLLSSVVVIFVVRLVDGNLSVFVQCRICRFNENYRFFVVFVVFVTTTKINLFSSKAIFVLVVVDKETQDLGGAAACRMQNIISSCSLWSCAVNYDGY